MGLQSGGGVPDLRRLKRDMQGRTTTTPGHQVTSSRLSADLAAGTFLDGGALVPPGQDVLGLGQGPALGGGQPAEIRAAPSLPTFLPDLARPVALPAGHVVSAAPAVPEPLREEPVAQPSLEKVPLPARPPAMSAHRVPRHVQLRVVARETGHAFACQRQRGRVKHVQVAEDGEQDFVGQTDQVEFLLASASALLFRRRLPRFGNCVQHLRTSSAGCAALPES